MKTIAKTTTLADPPRGHHKRMTTADFIQDLIAIFSSVFSLVWCNFYQNGFLSRWYF